MKTNKWNVERLHAMRLETDPRADEVISLIFSNRQLMQVNKVFDKLVNNEFDELCTDLPDQVRDYFIETKNLPTWFDLDKIKVVQNAYVDYAPQANSVLLCKSIPTCYGCRKGAQVLYATGRMREQNGSLDMFTQRIMETAQFIINTMEPDGFTEQGSAVSSMLKVRLIHTSIRYYLTKSNDWDEKKFDRPINQEDLLGTMLSMSTMIAEGLIQLGVTVTVEELEAFAHYGRVLGYMMGIKEEYLPVNYTETVECRDAILADQLAYSKEGEALTQSCLQFMKDLVPGELFDGIPEKIMRYMVSEEVCEAVGLESRKDIENTWLIKGVKWLNEKTELMEEKISIFNELSDKFNMILLNGMIRHYNDNREVDFNIPPSLRKNWDIE